MNSNYKLIIVLLLAVFLSSCSVTKMRYSRGLNIQFLNGRGEKTEEKTKQANVAHKKNNPAALEKPLQPEVEVSTAKTIEISTVNEESIKKVAKTNKTGFWKSYYKKVDKYETKYNQFKDKQLNKRFAPTKTSGDGTSGAWGIIGFIFGVLAILVLGLSVFGIIFSCLGLGRNRSLKGLAIAGLVLSIICFVILILALAAI
ncbi:MAG: DUF4190 domain-containing protein [Bacteroidota bacterium]